MAGASTCSRFDPLLEARRYTTRTDTTEARWITDGVVEVADTIEIVWVEDSPSAARQIAKFNRAELGIPQKLDGGTVRCVFTADGRWEVTFSREVE